MLKYKPETHEVKVHIRSDQMEALRRIQRETDASLSGMIRSSLDLYLLWQKNIRRESVLKGEW